MFCSLPKEYDQRLLSIKSKIVHACNEHNTACGINSANATRWHYSGSYYYKPTMKVVKAEITCKACLRVLHQDDFQESSRGLKYAIKHKDGFFLTPSKKLTGDINKAGLFLTEANALKTITKEKFKNIHTGEIVNSVYAEYSEHKKKERIDKDSAEDWYIFKAKFRPINVVDSSFEIIKIALTIIPNR